MGVKAFLQRFQEAISALQTVAIILLPLTTSEETTQPVQCLLSKHLLLSNPMPLTFLILPFAFKPADLAMLIQVEVDNFPIPEEVLTNSDPPSENNQSVINTTITAIRQLANLITSNISYTITSIIGLQPSWYWLGQPFRLILPIVMLLKKQKKF